MKDEMWYKNAHFTGTPERKKQQHDRLSWFYGPNLPLLVKLCDHTSVLVYFVCFKPFIGGVILYFQLTRFLSVVDPSCVIIIYKRLNTPYVIYGASFCKVYQCCSVGCARIPLRCVCRRRQSNLKRLFVRRIYKIFNTSRPFFECSSKVDYL